MPNRGWFAPTVPLQQLVLLRAAFMLTLVASCAGAQPLTVGTLTGRRGSDFGPLVTVVDGSSPSDKNGVLRSATFVWSNAPCPASAKIKFFQFQFVGVLPHLGYRLMLFAERGPFDVHDAIEIVTLDPPVIIGSAYSTVVGISSVTSCGGPAKAGVGPAAVYPGDYEGGDTSPASPFEAGSVSALVQASELSVPGAFRPEPRVIRFRSPFLPTLTPSQPASPSPTPTPRPS